MSPGRVQKESKKGPGPVMPGPSLSSTRRPQQHFLALVLLRAFVNLQLRGRAGGIVARLAVVFLFVNVILGPNGKPRGLGDCGSNASNLVDMLLGEIMHIEKGLLFES
jgi:hypothetical protein